MSADDLTLEDCRRLAELEQIAEMVDDMLGRELEQPGSVGDLAVQGLHSAVLFWSGVRSST